MRVFLSYDIDDTDFRGRVRRVQSELKATGCDLKLVNPDMLHFTIRFFGEISKDQVQSIVDALQGRVETFELDVPLRGLGVFPNERRISVIWVGTDDASSRKLSDQASQVNSKLSSIFSLPRQDSERFSPHITIARVTSAKKKASLVKVLESNRSEDFGVVKISPLRLKLSELTPSGPKYADLHVFE